MADWSRKDSLPIHQTARFQVKPESLSECEAAIREFVAYVKKNEPRTLLYVSLQEKDNPTRFIHYFIFEDEAAREVHANSEGVNRFTSVLYTRLVVPVEFTGYDLLATTDG